MFEKRKVRGTLVQGSDALHRKDIADFAHGMGRLPGVLYPIQQRESVIGLLL